MKSAKKKIITILLVLVILAAAIFAAYQIGLKFAADKAVNTIITNEINSMLDSGEMTLDEVIEIAELEPDSEEDIIDEPVVEAIPEPKKNTEQPKTKPGSQSTKPPSTEKKNEVVKKAAEKVNEDITASEKREVMKLIRANLTTEDLRFLLSALQGGVTKEEISQAAKIAYARFDSEEIVRVKEFWHKYKANIKRAKE